MIEESKGTPEHDIISTLLLRSMQKARYDAQCKRVLSQKELHMSDQLGKEMHLMCNLSDLVEEHGIQQGMKRGVQSGI